MIMVTYDLCVAWNWEYDADFVALLDADCRARGLLLMQITPDNLGSSLQALAQQQAGFWAFLDRVSDLDTPFTPLIQWICEHGIYYINSYRQAVRSWDKTVMHLALVNAGLDVPHTIILPPYHEQPDLSFIDLALLGEQFTIKPAHGSGGEGVMTQATAWNQVLSMRQECAYDRYLLQSYIVPRDLDVRPAWFRVIYCAGQIYPCWWSPHTHVYTPVTPAEQNSHGLGPLQDIIVTIAGLCGLDFFSTEIAFTPEGLFVVVDYVNDQIDLRLQSKAIDGVPDAIVHEIAKHLVDHILIHRCRK